MPVKYVIKGEIKVTRRSERICKQLLDDLNEARGYWKLKEEELACTVFRNDLGRSYGTDVKNLPDDDDDEDDDSSCDGGRVLGLKACRPIMVK